MPTKKKKKKVDIAEVGQTKGKMVKTMGISRPALNKHLRCEGAPTPMKGWEKVSQWELYDPVEVARFIEKRQRSRMNPHIKKKIHVDEDGTIHPADHNAPPKIEPPPKPIHDLGDGELGSIEGEVDYALERARKMRAERRLAELKLAEEERRLMDVGEATQWIREHMGGLKKRFLSLPQSAAKELEGLEAADIAQSLKERIVRILETTSDYDPRSHGPTT